MTALATCMRILALCLIIVASPAFAASASPLPATPPAAPDAELLARGKYLATVADCAACHTARDNGQPFAGGRTLGTPFGEILSSNVTPDPTYGIGRYTYEDFAKVMRRGIAPGNKRLYPAMPYTAYSKITDDDMRALYAYMMHGVAPVALPAPQTTLPFPMNQRKLLALWQWAFAPSGIYETKPDRDTVWNRGAYLVQGLGHCGTCHTPRGAGFQERGSDESSWRYLTGAINENWYASNLTGDPGSGLGRVTEDELVRFFRTGHGDGSAAYGSMVETIEKSMQHWTEEDHRAVAKYLKSLPPKRPSGAFDTTRTAERGPADGDRAADRETIGGSVYRTFCAQCHQPDGRGVPDRYPKLAGNPSVLAKDPTSLIRLSLEGGGSPVTLTGPPRQDMPGFGQRLTDLQIAQALTYLRGAWGNEARPVTTSDVAKLRQTLQKEKTKR